VCAPAYTAQSTIDTAPVFDLLLTNYTQNQCAPDPLTIRFANSGARSGAVAISVTLPVGLAYAGLASGSLPAPAVTPSIGATGTVVFRYTGIAQVSLTNTLAISVANDLQAAGACRSGGAIPVTLAFDDSCGIAAGSDSDAFNLTVTRSNLSAISQTPLTQAVVAGTVYTWTIALTNTATPLPII
jgi:hypothetical protein